MIINIKQIKTFESMKKNFKFAILSAIALVGAVGFSACSSSEDDLVVNNPTFNPETNTVTTQFILNVDYAQQTPTRQSAATVQRDFSAASGKNFRGIQDAKLIALGTGHSTWLAPFDGSATTGDGYVKKTFTLGTLYSNNAVDNLTSGGTNNNYQSSSHRVLQLELPVTTDAMLVYGRAIPSGNIEEDGKVDVSINSNPESSTFDLVSRLKGSSASSISDKSSEYDQTLNLAALILNRIMLSSVDATTGVYTYNSGQANEFTSSAALSGLTWKTIVGTGNGLPQTLRQAYDKVKVKTGESRNGSAKAVRELILDLSKTIEGVMNATATDDNEVNAQRLAYEIDARIDKYFTVDLSANTVSFNSIGSKSSSGTIMYALCGGSPAIVSETDFSTNYGSVTDTDLAGFPGSFGLPEGVAVLKQNTDDSFAYKNSTTDTDNSLLGTSGHMPAGNYMYPAELLYFDNSALYVNDADKKESDYPNGYNTWNTFEWTSTTNGWTQGAVSSSTKSVAVKSNINYGVAMLQTKVGFVELSGADYVDNRNAITGETNQIFTQNEMKNFKLTGVLVGNQYKHLQWNYITDNTDAGYIIYDKAIPTGFDIPTTAGKENYTLVFDNWTTAAAQTSDVYVALEFQNNAKAFFGNKNLIPVGGTFYLVGKLTLANGTGKDAWDATYATPPYTSAGATTEVNRVFIQNYMTTATFNIGATSLQNAFLTVPDLRSTQMSLGLSVDLSWKQGLTFTPTLGE